MDLKRWIVIGVVATLAAVVGGPWVYIHLISSDAPAPLTAMSDDNTAATTSSTGAGTTNGTTDGSWAVASGSQVGYRVNEVLFGQSATAVGRTDTVTGSMQVSGTTIESASFTVDMTTVASDESRRDNQFHNRIMQTGTYPTATFELTQPITFSSVPTDGASVTKTVTGKLTLHGTTKTVNVDLTGTRSGDTIAVKGSIPIVFAEWDIPNPSFGPVTTEDNGILEFALNFRHA
jgi:polyisoprenoid-binding protein YceI